MQNKLRRWLLIHEVELEEALERFGGSEEAYLHALFDLLNEAAFDALRTALACGSIPDAFEAAHRLKGEVLTLGLQESFRPLLSLVEELRTGRSGAAAALLDEIQEQRSELCELLEASGE